MRKCPFCDEMIDDNATVCPICGEDLPKEPLPEHEHPTEELVDRDKRECPICGEMISAHLDVCDICGEPTHFHDVPEEPVEELEIAEETPELTKVVPAEVPENEAVEAPEETIEETASFSTPEPVKTAEQVIPKQSVERPAVKTPFPEKKKKSNRGFIIGIIVLLLLALLGLLYLMFFKGNSSGKLYDGDDIELPMDSISQDPAKVKDIQALLDSIEREMNEDVVVVAKYPDEDRACMYYLFNGELFKYNALNGVEETVNVPMDEETDVVLFAEPEGDGQYIKIDMANENMEHTAFYRLNTQTGKILREKKEPTPDGGQELQDPPVIDGKGQGEMPPPPPPGEDNPKTKAGKSASTQKQAPPPPARNKVRPQQRAEEEVPPPPPSNGPGYRLEPINKSDVPKSNNNGGYHF